MLTKLFHNLDYKAGCEHPRPARMHHVYPSAPPRTSAMPAAGVATTCAGELLVGRAGLFVGVVGCSRACGAVQFSVAVLVGGR